MTPLIVLAMLGVLSGPAVALGQSTAALVATEALPAAEGTSAAEAAPEGAAEGTALGVGPHPASAVDWDAQLYTTRPLVVFADSPENPDFQRQLLLIERDLPALEERRVVVVLDTDPAAMGDWRKRLRPNGFSLVLLDTDLRPVTRKPKPWDMREVSRTIDRLPSRRQELSQQFPAGR